MSNALYFSTGSLSPEHFFHYGLALDHYTHFTSPIRRYADVIVSVWGWFFKILLFYYFLWSVVYKSSSTSLYTPADALGLKITLYKCKPAQNQESLCRDSVFFWYLMSILRIPFWPIANLISVGRTASAIPMHSGPGSSGDPCHLYGGKNLWIILIEIEWLLIFTGSQTVNRHCWKWRHCRASKQQRTSRDVPAY